MLITAEDWDYLILLDACRYDYFAQAAPRFLAGSIQKRESVGCCTSEWRDKTFTDRYDDIVYVSSNPYISDLMPVNSFWGREHFHKVYDVWRTGWDEKIGTVRPETITAAAISAIRAHKGKRFIFHYLQPHAPYLSLGNDASGFPLPNPDASSPMTGTVGSKADSVLQRAVLRLLRKLFPQHSPLGNQPEWILRQWLRMAPASPMDLVRRKYGVEVLRQAYLANLEAVLAEVAGLLRYLSGRIIVTSDHGEMLGEDRSFSHIAGQRHPLLVEVPWMTIDKEIADAPDTALEAARANENAEVDQKEKDAMKEKLKALGYFD
jgi:hypothetical protein